MSLQRDFSGDSDWGTCFIEEIGKPEELSAGLESQHNQPGENIQKETTIYVLSGLFLIMVEADGEGGDDLASRAELERKKCSEGMMTFLSLKKI